MFSNRWLIAIIGIIVVIAGVLVVRAIWAEGESPSSPLPAFASGVEQRLIERAGVIQPTSPSEATDLITQLRAACRRSCEVLSAEQRLSAQRADALSLAAAERMAMYLEPSYEAYREYCKRLSGRDPMGSGAMNICSNAEDFEKRTASLRMVPFDPAAAQVRACFIIGVDVSGELTARLNFKADMGMFFTPTGLDPAAARATIYEVLVPVFAPDAMRPEDRVMFVLSMAFALDPATSTWKPWRMGYYDPSGADRRISPPWL